MRRLLKNMKTILTLKVRGSSVLATQKYGERLQKSKPENQSILGAYAYGKRNDSITEGKKNNAKGTCKNK